MLTFKKYTELSESTKDLYKAIGERETKGLLETKVDPKIKKMHDKVFGEGNSHIEIPLHDDIPDSVKAHVKSNGDELSGDKVKLKSGRLVEISKYLGKSKAPKHVVDAHEHWDRNKGEYGNTKLVITRHPGEVASASTGTHWKSCAEAPKNGDIYGPAWEAMPKELEHSTLMAMHVHKDAKPNADGEYDSKDIYGRQLAKRHSSYDGKEDSFFPENKKYGAFSDAASKAFRKFTNKNYPMGKAALHHKNEDVYDDDGNSTKFNPSSTDEDLHKLLKHKNAYTRLSTLEHPSIAESHIHAALDDENPSIRRQAAKHKNATPKNIDKALDDDDGQVATAAASNMNATPKNIDKALDYPSVFVKKNAASHPNASSENLHKAIKIGNATTATAAIGNKNATSEHIAAALRHEATPVRIAAASHPKASDETLHAAIRSPDDAVGLAAINNINAKKEHFEYAAKNHPNHFVRHQAQNRLHFANTQ